MNEENGTLYMKKINKGCDNDDFGGGDVGGEEEGEEPIIANAGAVVVMGDRTWHRSSGNWSENQRRVWMPQFSSGKIMWEASGEPVSFAVKML